MAGKAVKNFYAATSTKADLSGFMETFFQNVYNDNDYDILEDLWANTIAGSVIDKKCGFVMGAGIKPTIRLRKPKDIGNEEAQKAYIEKQQDTIDSLIDLDDKKKVKFNEKLHDGLRMMKVFGRDVLAFEPGGKSEVRALKPLHPRDLGRVNVHQDDWSLSSVQVFNKSDLIYDDEMIYLCNMPNSPRRRSMHYGYSEIQRVVGSARALRKIMEFDGPEISETMWAGYGLISVDTIAKSPGAIKDELEEIRGGLQPGALNLINGKKDDVNYWKFDLDPKIQELVELAKFYERTIIGHSGVPAALFGREEDQNMATLFGKIRMFIAGPVREDREMLSRITGEQWYEHNLKYIAPELINVVAIEPEFEPVVLESWVDVIESLAKLKAVFPSLPEKELLVLANLQELQDKLGKTTDANQIKKDTQEIQEKLNKDEITPPGKMLRPDQLPENPMAPRSSLKS